MAVIIVHIIISFRKNLWFLLSFKYFS